MTGKLFVLRYKKYKTLFIYPKEYVLVTERTDHRISTARMEMADSQTRLQPN